jgi:polyphosphate kinase
MQNRELSWLRFNERVLEEANDPDTPLFERFFFLNVYTTNLDEFFMVRVGSFQSIARSKTRYTDGKTGMGAIELLSKVFEATAHLYRIRDATYAKIEAELARHGVARKLPLELSRANETLLYQYYQTTVVPLLAPQVVDKTHPFPHLENKRIIIALHLDKKGEKVFGMIPLPTDIERLFFFENGDYILLEDILLYYCENIFKKYTILERAVISVTRNADIDTVEEQFDADEDFLDHMEKLLKRQQRLDPVRLEVQGEHTEKLSKYLRKRLNLDAQQVFNSTAPLDLSYHVRVREQVSDDLRKQLCYAPFESIIPHAALSPEGMFARLRQGDVMLFHPYESLQPYLSLIKEASEDKAVVSIQITLYRLADHQSRLVEHLITAAEMGKQVIVFIELRARMDEENNVGWAKRLEEAGCSVFYGQLGYKMHAKITLITRSDLGRYEHFVHIGTGNYNEKSAKTYADISLMTTNKAIAQDAIAFFHNMLVGAVDESYPTLWLAPQDFKPGLLNYIRREAARGPEGSITIKCNALTDKDVIKELVAASMAGTPIDLILRGICCLLPGVPNLTENIHIRSIVGRFLEHSRIYCFGTGADRDLYIGSGDMMTRNTTRRVELFTPVFDPALRARIFGLLDIDLHDNVKARSLTSSGQYISERSGDAPLDSQKFFMNEAIKEAEKTVETTMVVVAQPRTSLLKRLRAFFSRR